MLSFSNNFLCSMNAVNSHSNILSDIYSSFKQFDTVKDASDHYYFVNREKSSDLNWTKRVQKEWSILESSLPERIWVRAYEDRMDLMRAAILGPPSTPYYNFLFFFDIWMPPQFPSVPPQVHYLSGGVRVNPNLYDNGYVCLSLLGTWSGNGTEKWMHDSSILQVLVSLQGLVLVSEPYFNEPGYESQKGTSWGQTRSKDYSENAYILSSKTMMYLIRTPPKHFEELIRIHCAARKKEILDCCEAYSKGLQIGGYPIPSSSGQEPSLNKSLTQPSFEFKPKINEVYTKLSEVISSM